MGEKDEEDYGALIYRESQLRKAEAAAAVAAKAAKDDAKNKKKSSLDVSSTHRRRATSTRVTSTAARDKPGDKPGVNAAHKTKASKRKRKIPVGREEQAPRKVAPKQYRKICSADGCTNQVQKGGLCRRHGAKTKRCSVEGCKNHAKKGGVCIKHGAKKTQCSMEECTNHAVRRGVCIKHGAKVEYKGCSVEGCTNLAQKRGVCMKHGAKRKLCSSAVCTNSAKKGGVCIKHGAKVKRCSFEGCTNHSKRGGVCRRHGAYRNPHDESTAFTSCFGSDFDKTTLTHPTQRTPAASASQDSVPEEVEVAVCGVTTDNLTEV